jgi:nucleoside-diphosphate-sugar epimerase
MTALVTGASGFVGRHLAEELLAAGTPVRALVRDPAAASPLRVAGAEVLAGDVLAPGILREAMRGIEVAYHCAAAIGQPPKFSGRDVYHLNLKGTRNLLEAARQVGAGRVVLLTSVNVLGTCHLDLATEDLPCRRSGDPSADVKIDIEALAWQYERHHGLDVTVLRPGLIYGPRDRHNLPRLIAALCDGRFRYIGGRDHVIPIVHVSDVVRAMLLAARAPAARGRAYHITDGSRTTVGEFIGYLADLLGCPRPQTVARYVFPYVACLFCEFIVRSGLGRFLDRNGIYRAPPPITRSSLRFLGTSRSFDIRRAREELGYAPRIGHREGLAATVRWFTESATRSAEKSASWETGCHSSVATSETCRHRDELRERVREAVCRHWPTPHPRGPIGRLPPGQVEELSRATLDTLLTRQFRVGPLPPPDIYAQLLERVRHRVRRGQPLHITVGFAPLKNQNAVAYSRADWAEFFALCHLVAWHNKVQRVYPPGLRLQIVFDDSTLALANGAERRVMDPYMNSVADLILALGLDSIFAYPLGQSGVTWLFHLGLYQLAEWRVHRWERDPANQEQLERMAEFARRNVTKPPALSPGEQERRLRRASHRFRVCWEAMQLSGLPRCKGRILAVYLDGSQHHGREVALHLTTLDKGQITQPWQGEGALLDNGRGKLEPFVLTAGRRRRHDSRQVEGLDLIGQPGFERIAVVWPAARPGRGSEQGGRREASPTPPPAPSPTPPVCYR